MLIMCARSGESCAHRVTDVILFSHNVNSKQRTSMKALLPSMLVLTAGLWLSEGSLGAQESLRDVVEGHKVGWIIGQWTATNSQAQTIAVEYEWALDGHLVEVELAIGSTAYKGLISLRPTDGVMVETGADNRGGMTQAIWREKDGAFISERTATRPDGREAKVAVVITRVDADTLKATVHSLSSGGEIGVEPAETVTLKRVPVEEPED